MLSLVGIEACASAHHRSREPQSFGHKVRLGATSSTRIATTSQPGAVRKEHCQASFRSKDGNTLPALRGELRGREMKELRALPVNVAILDTSGTIVDVNDTWKEFARQNGLRLPNFGIGSNYLQFCVSDGPYPSLSAANLKELLAGQKKLLTLIYPCDSPTNKRWFSLIGLQLLPIRGPASRCCT